MFITDNGPWRCADRWSKRYCQINRHSKSWDQSKFDNKKHSKWSILTTCEKLPVNYPSISMEQSCWSKELLWIPPVGRAWGSTASTKYTFIQPIKLFPVCRWLPVLPTVLRGLCCLQPWLYQSSQLMMSRTKL